MTPFHIRAKLKALVKMALGGGGAKDEPAPRVSYTVTFEVPDGTTYETQAKDGDSIVLASGRGPLPINTGCADGTCATCRVDVLAGADSLTPQAGQEEKTKKDNGVPDAQRLGCQVGVIGPGVRVRIINVFGEEPIDP